MIVLATSNDEPLAVETQRLLQATGLRSSRHDVVTLAMAQERLSERSLGEELIFAVGLDFEHLAELIRRLASLSQGTVIAISRNAGSQQILRLIRAGAADYIDLDASAGKEFSSVVARLLDRQASSRGRGKLIGIASASGGCGGSSIAVNLGIAMADKSHSVCLIDLDLGGGGLACLLNLQPPHTLADLCSLNRQIDESAFESAIVRSRPNLGLLAAPVFSSHAGDFNSRVVEQIIDLARDQFSYVLVDFADASRTEHRSAIVECDLLLIALRLEFPCILRTRELLRYLIEAGVEKEKLRLAANRCQRREALPRNKVIEALGTPIAAYIPDDADLMLTAVNVGAPAIAEAPSSKFAKSIRDLAEAMVI